MAISAYCPTCGHVFSSRFIQISGNVRNLTLRDNKEQCPRCGAMANVQDGVFDVVNGVLREIKRSGISPESAMALASLGPIKASDAVDEDEVIAAAMALNPELGKVFGAMKGRGVMAVVLMILMFVLSRCDVKLNVDLDVNDLINQISEPAITETLPDKPRARVKNTNKHQGTPKADSTRRGTGEEDGKALHESTPKEKSRRRSYVKKQQRLALRKRRKAFNPKR